MYEVGAVASSKYGDRCKKTESFFGTVYNPNRISCASIEGRANSEKIRESLGRPTGTGKMEIIREMAVPNIRTVRLSAPLRVQPSFRAS